MSRQEQKQEALRLAKEFTRQVDAQVGEGWFHDPDSERRFYLYDYKHKVGKIDEGIDEARAAGRMEKVRELENLRDILRSAGWLGMDWLETTVASSANDRSAFVVMQEVAAYAERKRWGKPDVLADFSADILEGKRTPPSSRRKFTQRDKVVVEIVTYVKDLSGVAATRNDESLDDNGEPRHFSACDAVADALDSNFRTIKGIWTNRARDAELTLGQVVFEVGQDGATGQLPGSLFQDGQARDVERITEDGNGRLSITAAGAQWQNLKALERIIILVDYKEGKDMRRFVIVGEVVDLAGDTLQLAPKTFYQVDAPVPPLLPLPSRSFKLVPEGDQRQIEIPYRTRSEILSELENTEKARQSSKVERALATIKLRAEKHKGSE